tara:strand:+ start:3740 stop:5767 length:2028 start_codon:yes stop_codon:yes gene_type:complete
MGIFSVLEERASPGPADDFWYEPISRYTENGEVTPAEAIAQTPVWAAVNLISGTLGSLPLITYRELPDGGKEKEKNLPLYNMLRWNPNPFQTAVEFVEMAQGHLCLRGNFFARLQTNRLGDLVSIVPLHPDKIKLKLIDTGMVEYHYQEGAGPPRVFSQEEILHVKGLSSDGLIGYSPITVGAGAIALSASAERYGSRFFRNSATPSGILSHPGKLKPEARSNIKQSWSSAHGNQRQHSVALLEEGLSWTALSVSPDEAQFIETRKYQAEEIARLFNVPPHLLMLLDRSTFSNVTEQNRSFATNCIRPWAIRFEQAIRKSILERFAPDQGIFCEFDMRDLLRPDTMARAQASQILLQNGVLSIDEWRASENLNPLGDESGSVHWMPMNIAPVSVAETNAPNDENRNRLLQEMRSLQFDIRDDATLHELRSLANRKKIADATMPLIREASARLIKREVKAVRRMMKKHLSGLPDGRELRGTDSLFQDLEEFYHGEFTDTIINMMLPVIRSYAQQIYTQAALEVGYPSDFTPELEEFVQGYLQVMANHHSKNSRQQLQSLISQTDFVDLINALDVRLEQWLANRAEKVARKETSEGNGAFSKFAYVAGGVMGLRWVTAGSETCPFCKKLSGKIVGTMERFVEAGQSVESEAGNLTPRNNIGHPPLHSGCDCFISPSL